MSERIFEGRYTDWRGIKYEPAIDKHFPGDLVPRLPDGARLLEVGCHDGSVCLNLAAGGYSVSGVDINPEAIVEAQRKTRDLGLQHSVDFKVLDAVEEGLGAYDATILIRVLTCVPDETEWVRLVSRVWQTIVPGGFLYVHDFKRVDDSAVYGARYRQGMDRGWRAGNFVVSDAEGTSLFVAHHHDERDIARIQAPGETLVWREHPSLSMNGNPCSMFVYIGRKPVPSGLRRGNAM